MTTPTGVNDTITGGLGATAANPTGTAHEAGAADHGTTDSVKTKAREFAGKAQETAKTKARSTVDSQKSKAADTIGTVAQTLRGSTDQLRDQNQEQIGQYIASAADQMERLAEYLRTTETDELVRKAEEIARRQPALFLGGAFALGILSARFLKSSRRAQFEESGDRQMAIDTFDERRYGASSFGATSGTGLGDASGLRATGYPTLDESEGLGYGAGAGGSSLAGGLGMGTTGGASHDALSSATDRNVTSAFGAGGNTMHTSDSIDDLTSARPSGLEDPDSRA
jgi:hypothetical protein